MKDDTLLICGFGLLMGIALSVYAGSGLISWLAGGSISGPLMAASTILRVQGK